MSSTTSDSLMDDECRQMLKDLYQGEDGDKVVGGTKHINLEIPCDESWEATLTKYSFATEGVGLFTVAVVGILANFLSIAVLCHKTMKTHISALLITLAVFDTLFLLCTFPVFTIMSVHSFINFVNTCIYPDGQPFQLMTPDAWDAYYFCLPFLYGLTHVSKVGSVFTTLAVSLERYFAVCRPLWIRVRRCHPALYIVLVTVFAFGFNIPKFMEFEVVTSSANRTVVAPSALRTNENYVIYYNFLTKTLLTELFPYVSLIFLNACIYKEIRRSVKIQRAMRCTQSQKEEIKSANVVVGVVLLSILCHIWKIVPDLYEAIISMRGNNDAAVAATAAAANGENCTHFLTSQEEADDDLNINIEFIIDTSHLLVGVNSAANFFLYCLLRRNFRISTWRILTCKRWEDGRNSRMAVTRRNTHPASQAPIVHSSTRRTAITTYSSSCCSRRHRDCSPNPRLLSNGGRMTVQLMAAGTSNPLAELERKSHASADNSFDKRHVDATELEVMAKLLPEGDVSSRNSPSIQPDCT